MQSATAQVLRSELPLGEALANIGSLFLRNRAAHGPTHAFAQREGGEYRYRTWDELVGDLLTASAFLLSRGLQPGDRVGFVSSNGYERLVAEMAAMSSGLVSVPIFAGYPKDLLSELLAYSELALLATDDPAKLAELPPDRSPGEVLLLRGGAPRTDARLPAGKTPFTLEQVLKTPAALGPALIDQAQERWRQQRGAAHALVMYTSGTSGFPKGVQLTHHNLLSQQRALELLWKPEAGMRFLCYLPWHHSFGGLFERFCALSSGGCLAIDDSWGKDLDQLLRNFAEIRPNVYFSVPKIYQDITARVLASPEAERVFFHPELRFVFTAAAPLPMSTSNVFKAKGVPVVEGWGLTETSPCCTLTELSLDRQPGVVGFPIPGVEIRLGEDNEILVRGPNVMTGYFRNAEATRAVLGPDGWFATGDVGELTPGGLKIVSRKDRMFKLSNGEKVFPAVLEDGVRSHCRFVKHAYVFGKGQQHPLLLVFPNLELLSAGGSHLDDSDCKYPGTLDSLTACLGECLERLNQAGRARFEMIQSAVIVQREPLIDNAELTPSFKLIPRRIDERYRPYLKALEEGCPDQLPKDAHLVEIRGRFGRSAGGAASARRLHYGVIGVGPVGTVLATHLRAAGHRVTLLSAFPRRLEAFTAETMVISGALHAHAKFEDVLLDLREFVARRPDVVLLAVKNSVSQEILGRLQEEGLDPKALLVSCQNGLDVERQISRVFGSHRALRMVVNMGCSFSSANEVKVAFCFPHVLSLSPGVDAEVTAQIAAELQASGYPVELRGDYQTYAFKKVILNSSLGSVCALTGMTMRAVMQEPELSRIVKQMVREGITVARADGVPLSEGFLDEAVGYLAQGGDHKPSILMDIEAGRKTENESHCGTLYEHARKQNIEVPVTQTLYYLLKNREAAAMKSLKRGNPL